MPPFRWWSAPASRRARPAGHRGDAARQRLHDRQARLHHPGAAGRSPPGAGGDRPHLFDLLFSEHFEARSTVKAGELVQAGAIGKVVQTIGLGPHRISLPTRAGMVLPARAIRRHPLRHRLAPVRPVPVLHRLDRGRSRQPQVGNFAHPQYPGLEDFGDCMRARQRRHRLRARGLVHAGRAAGLGRRALHHPGHRGLHRAAQVCRHCRAAGRRPPVPGRPEGRAVHRLLRRGAALRPPADRTISITAPRRP